MADTFSTSAALSALYRFANKPDENLGRSGLGPFLCRITEFSATGLMDMFLSVDWEYQRATWLKGPLSSPVRHFVDLGCGRGLVCAAALNFVSFTLKSVVGWDIDAKELEWARKHVQSWRRYNPPDILAEVPPSSPYANADTKVSFEEADASEFRVVRDVLNGEERDTMREAVWIYAFWSDWHPATKSLIARRLLLEDYQHWSVFACTSKPEQLVAYLRHTPGAAELFWSAYKLAGSRHVALSGSGQGHRIYFYVKQQIK